MNYDNRQNDNRNDNRKYDNRRNRKERKGANMNAKKCPHCGCDMKPKGALDCMGAISYKCKNKACGRRVVIRKNLAHPPIPLVPNRRAYRR